MTMQMSRRSMIAGLALSGCVAATHASNRISFHASDGARLSGLSWGEGSHAVLLVPGAHGVGQTWQLQALQLAQDFRVLALDYRGLGASSGAQDADKLHLDILDVLTRLKAEGAQRLSVIGASWGGGAAARAAIAQPGLVDRLVLLANSGFDDPEKLGGRKLFIVADEDRDGSGNLRIDGIRRQYDLVPEPKKMVVVSSAAHAQFLFLTDEGARVMAEIRKFLTAP
jgi:pimeloyl-ACP methyl ester carboxylesterase